MAAGMDVFRSHFSAYQDQYVLIGGMACDLLLNEAGERFRPTRDVDMVLIVEALTSEFAEAFWAFIEAGGYEARLRNSGKPEFYRFVNPKQPEYPVMIELFARPGNNVNLSATGHLTPLHIDDDISSLSAITPRLSLLPGCIQQHNRPAVQTASWQSPHSPPHSGLQGRRARFLPAR